MNNQNLTEQAKDGNPKAIAALMNQVLEPKGIRVIQCYFQKGCFRLILEGASIQHKDKIIDFVKKFMNRLAVDQIQDVQIVNRLQGSTETNWFEKFSLGNGVKVHPSTPSKPQPKSTASRTHPTSPTINSPHLKSTQNNTTPNKVISKLDNDKNDLEKLLKLTAIISAFFLGILIFAVIPGFWFLKILSVAGIITFIILNKTDSYHGSNTGNTLRKVYRPKARKEFIESYLHRCFIRTLEPKTDYYYIHIPTKIYKIYTEHSKYRIKLGLIYFSLINGEFREDYKTINYDLEELYLIFWDNIKGVKTKMYVSWGENALVIVDENSKKIDELYRIRQIKEEIDQVKKDRESVDKELSKIESLIKTLETSDLYKSKVDIYKRATTMLQESKEKAIFVVEEYTKFLKDYVLEFYLTDIEPSFLQGKTNELEWTERYKVFQDDYMMLKSMIQEYDKLKEGDSL